MQQLRHGRDDPGAGCRERVPDRDGLLLADWYGAMGRDWGPSALADQQLDAAPTEEGTGFLLAPQG